MLGLHGLGSGGDSRRPRPRVERLRVEKREGDGRLGFWRRAAGEREGRESRREGGGGDRHGESETERREVSAL